MKRNYWKEEEKNWLIKLEIQNWELLENRLSVRLALRFYRKKIAILNQFVENESFEIVFLKNCIFKSHARLES
jgi:hypothetical protein